MFKYIRLFLFIRQQHPWWIPLLFCSLKMNSLFSRSTMQLLLLDLPHAYSEDSLLLLVLNPVFWIPHFSSCFCSLALWMTFSNNSWQKVHTKYNLYEHKYNFPGGPVVKILNFHCRGCGFDFWSGKLPEVWPKKKNTNICKCPYPHTWQSSWI